MDVRKHLDNKCFDLAFEAIDELCCHANSYDVAKASHDIQNIRMRSSETLIEFFARQELDKSHAAWSREGRDRLRAKVYLPSEGVRRRQLLR
jgi:hypothetical protein